MAVTLVGTVVSSCDTAGDFTTINGGANISGDDDFVEGTGAIGDKMSNTTEILASDTLSGGAAGVYDFSVGGADEGDHFIGWINTKTPVNATTGLAVYFRNASGHLGTWNVMPASFYKGGFITRVQNPAADFNAATTWTTTGNPAQLDDVSIMGFQFTTITSIMGSFNNVQCDQFTVGTGIRVDAGTSGTPNTFETVRSADEDTNFWGWWSAANGAFVGKGKLYIGPATGTTASWFVDTAFAVTFAEENVAVGFYEFSIRGANTTCTWDLANISSANSAAVRWSITLDSAMGSVTGGFDDTNGVWSGYDTITLNQYASLTGTTLIDGSLITQNNAALTGITLLDADTVSGEHAILSDNPSDITDSSFTQGAGGHAVRCDTVGTYNWTGNSDSGYTGTRGTNLVSSTGSTDAMFYNNSGGLITLNVSGGGQSPSVRNGAGATTQVNNNVTLTFSNMRDNTEVRIYTAGTKTELDGIENATAGSPDARTFAASLSGGTSVDYTLVNEQYEIIRVESFTWPSSDQTLIVQQRFDRNFIP